MAYSPDDPNLLLAPPGLRRPGLVPLPQSPALLQPPPDTLRRLSPPPVPPQADADLDQAAVQAAQQQAARQEYGQDHPFLSGLASGWQGLKASGHGIAGLAKGAVGDTAGERASLQAMQTDQAQAADYDSGSPDSLHKINGVGDAFTWAEHQLGAAIPGIAATVLPAIATGGVGGLVSGGLRRAALAGLAREAGEAAIAREGTALGADAAAGQAARNVAARAGTNIAESATPEEAASMATDAVAQQQLPRLQQIANKVSPASTPPAEIGKQAGAVAGGTYLAGAPAASNVDPNASDADLQTQSRQALAGAVGEGALMAVPGLALMRRYGVGAAAEKALAEKMSKPLWRRMLQEGGEQAAIGGLIAPATVAANHVVHNWITGKGLTDGLVSPDALSEYLNSAASGAVAGAVLGAPAGARFSDIKLPSLGAKGKLWRLSQRIGKAQENAAPKPGEEVNLDGTAKTGDAGAIFNQRLDQIQRARSQFEQDTFGDLKPYDLNEDHTGAVTIGTTDNVPGAKLFDPVAVKQMAETYPDKLEATVASLLPPAQHAVPSTTDAVKATAKAIRNGFDSLDKSDQTNVGRYLNSLPDTTQTPFKRLLLTVGALNDGQRARLTLAPSKDAASKVAPDAASIGANEEGRAAIGTEGGEGTGGLEGKLTERDALPNEELGTVPDRTWTAAHFSGDISKSTMPREEQVAVEVPKKSGTGTTTQALNLRMAASGLTKTEAGRALLEGEPNRKVGAVLGVIGEAATRGETISPRSIREGMHVFPDDGEESGVLTASDVAEIRRRVASQGTLLSRQRSADARAEMQRDAEAKPARSVEVGVAAENERQTRGESKQSIIDPESPERTAGEGDFNDPGADERIFAPRTYPGVGTGDTQVMKGDAGAARSRSLANRIIAGDQRHEGAVATLKRQYGAAKKMAETAKARGDQPAHSRAVANMKDAAEQAQALRTKHAERRAAIMDQFREAGQTDVRVKERGAAENPVAGRGSKEYEATLDDVDRLAGRLKVDRGRVSSAARGSGTKPPARDDVGRLTASYKAAKRLPTSEDQRGLLTSIRRVADGNDRLTEQLDKVDGVKHPKERVGMTNSEKAAKAGPLELKNTAQKPNARSDIEHSKVESDDFQRADDEPRSVKQTVEAVKQSPAFKEVQKALDEAAATKDNPRQTESKLNAVVKQLSKRFGIEAPSVRLFDRGDNVVQVNGENHELGIGAYQTGGKTPIIHIRSDLAPHEMISTLMHEYGHHMMRELYDKLPDSDPTKQAIKADFDRWLKERVSSNETARSIRSSRAPFLGTLADVRLGAEGKPLDMASKADRDYLLHFNEYFADSTARALQGHAFVQKAVGRFFAKVAHAMQLVHDMLTGSKHAKMGEAPQSFKDFVQNAFEHGSAEAPEDVARASYEAANAIGGKMPREEALAAASDAPTSPGTTGAGENPPPGQDPNRPSGSDGSRPSDISHTLNARDRGLIERLVTRRDVFEKILKSFPQLRDRLMAFDTQMDTAVNAAYALWSKGELKLSGEGQGTGYAGAMRRFGENIQNVFGLKSGAELGERIFDELRRDRYAASNDVRARQRADYLADLRQRQTKAKDAEAVTLKARIGLRRSINYALHVRDHVIEPLVNKMLRGLDDQLRRTNIPAIRQLLAKMNRMTGEVGDEESFNNAFHREFGTWANALATVVDPVAKGDHDALAAALFTGKPIEGNPALEVKRKELLNFAARFESYVRGGLKEGQGKMGHIDQFAPYRIMHTLVRDNEGEFRDILSSIKTDPKLEAAARDYFRNQEMRQGKSKEEAEKAVGAMTPDEMIDAFYHMASSDPALRRNSPEAGDPLMRGTAAPTSPSFRPRVMHFLRQAGRQDLIDRMAKFQNPDLYNTYLPMLRSGVKRAEYYRRFIRARKGEDGKIERYSLVDELLTKAKKQGAKNEDIQRARDYVDASLGVYGDPEGPPIIKKMFAGMDSLFGTKLAGPDSRAWEHISNAMVTYQNIRVLGLGALGNLIDGLGPWTRSSSFSTALAGYRAGLKAAWGKSNPTYLRAQAEALGVVERHALSEALSMSYGATGTPGSLSYKINQALFRYNGMHFITNFARVAALASGHKFLLEHAQLKGAHSARYLRELGLDAKDIKPDAQHPGFVDTTSPKVQKALFQFVDEAVVRPHAGQRPLWHADPGFKMAAQYRGFVFSFYDTIVKRMIHEVKNGNIGGVAPLVGYLGVTMAAEMMRELVQYGVAGNPNRENWGATDWTLYSLQRSGALGPRADFMNSAYEELAHSNVPIPYEALTGPTISQADDLLRTATGQRGTGGLVLESAPGESIYHGWVHRGKGSDTHQTAGQAALNFADDFVLE